MLKRRAKPTTINVEPGAKCFFCGKPADAKVEGNAFMTVTSALTGMHGAWPVHLGCVDAAEHPDAEDVMLIPTTDR
jgi:hypothetical protein